MSADDLRHSLALLREGRILHQQIYGLLHDLGEAGLVEAAEDVARFVRNPDPNLRYIALNVLTFHWNMPMYRRECEQLLFEDPDEQVRGMAAAGLGFVLRESKDCTAASMLLQKLRDKNETGLVRHSAYDAVVDMWLSPHDSRRGPSKARALYEESSDETERAIALSEELDRAKAAGDEHAAGRLSAELRMLADAEIRRWERFVDWDLVASIERECSD
jgi:hypothetical protein